MSNDEPPAGELGADVRDEGDPAPADEVSSVTDDDVTPVDPCASGQCRPYPAPNAFPPNRGPGGPRASFSDAQLYANCAYLDGGATDQTDHHNLVAMVDGYLVMPFAPEFGACGGLAFFDVSDPCRPVRVGVGGASNMRETHAIGFWSHAGKRWAATNYIDASVGLCLPVFGQDGGTVSSKGGIMFWDITDVTQPTPVSELPLEGFMYPDAYARVVQSLFWQAPYVYVSGSDNGVYVVDATDPVHPHVVGKHDFQPTLRAAGVHAIGNLLIVGSAEGSRTVLLDISDPAHPQPIPGGDFVTSGEDGVARDTYFTNVANGWVYYAPKSGGGGVMVYDVRDPRAPRRLASVTSFGNGGYVGINKQFAFVGESSFASIYDLSDMNDVRLVHELRLTGDLDTAVPIGNVVVLSVDDGADEDKGSAIAPWRATPDADAPVLTWVTPADGAELVPTTSRIGLSFDEAVDPGSCFPGSIRLYRADRIPELGRVDGYISAQDTVATFWPAAPLAPFTSYVLEVPAGGVTDFNGNPLAATTRVTFRTGP